MADTNLLASILAGNDPNSPTMLQGYQGAQLSNAALDPNFGHNEGPLGALAKMIAGMRGGGMTSDAVNAVTQARSAAQPDFARLVASQDPYKDLAANPDQYSPLARAMILNGASPESVAKSRLLATQAAQAGLNLGGYQGIRDAIAGGGAPATGPLPGRNAGAAMTAGPATSGRFQPTGAAAQPESGAPAVDPLTAAAGMSLQQRQAMLQNPQMRAQALARLRALAQQRAAAAAQGAGGALRPPT